MQPGYPTSVWIPLGQRVVIRAAAQRMGISTSELIRRAAFSLAEAALDVARSRLDPVGAGPLSEGHDAGDAA